MPSEFGGNCGTTMFSWKRSVLTLRCQVPMIQYEVKLNDLKLFVSAFSLDFLIDHVKNITATTKEES